MKKTILQLTTLKMSCSLCKDDEGKMESDEGEPLCADCYWNLDAQAKYKLRSDPKWRFHRVISTSIILLGMSEEQAYKKAIEVVKDMKGGSQWLLANNIV